MIIDNLNKRPVATIPNDTADPPRFAQPVETAKDSFVLELKKFFDRNQMTASRLAEIPTIRKYDLSFKSSETSHETAVKLIQKFPGIEENLPLVAILGATGRNLPMGLGTQKVSPVLPPVSITGTNAETYNLSNEDTLEFSTTDRLGVVRNTTIIFLSNRFVDITQATAAEIAREVNFQSLYAHASVTDTNEVQIYYGGPLSRSTQGDIEITGGDALATLGFTIGQKAEFRNATAFHRYQSAAFIDIAVEIVTQDHNIRTELSDIVWSFFTFYLDDQDYTFYGRSSFDIGVSNETYQVIIKPDPSMAGEQEVPRPGDETDKLYVNRINVPTTTIQYIDRAVVVPGTTNPLYLDPEDITQDDTIPQKN